ncbi:fibronectin type III domain protein [Ruminococcus albus 8]|uniref:Fibronectin type III domain protein n=1 Tax=Ruminococcus albus 8 TaxID=246199 RepID=E9SF06_RUMAL|nr:fibronectin type III domain-containing protein [Ruminococcus albus]EGC02136.1 fibronectin type III domain protein [Ruminococcus albus 8]
MTYKRIISGLLALSLTASMMPTAIADTNDDSNTNNENTNTVTINNENTSGQMILTLNVKGTLDLSLEMADWAYKSEASEPVLTGNTGNGDVTYYYKPQGAEDSAYTTEKPTAEGAYTVKAEVAETEGYYGGTAYADFKITPLTAGMEINLKVKKTITRDDYEFILPDSLVYDGKAKVFGVVNNNTDMPEATVEYYNAEGVKLDSAPVNAGKFTIKVVYGENEEYKAVTFDNIGTFNIVKADAHVTEPKAVEDLVFDGNVHDLVEAGSTKSGEIKYRIVDKEQSNVENDWQTIIPTATNAGEYVVEWKVFDADENNWNVEPAEGRFFVTIAEANAKVTAPKAIDDLVFNGTGQELVEAGSTSDGVMEYKVDEGEWSADLPKATDAGKHIVYYRVNFGDDKDNYVPVSGDVDVEIAKATAKVTAPKAIEGLKYNREEQTLVEAGSTSGGVMEYRVDEGEWSADLPKATDAGDHFVYCRVNFGDDAENWNEVDTDPIVVNIDNTFTVTWKNGDKTIETDELVEFGTVPSYDGEEPTMTGEDNEVFVFSGWDKDIDEVTEDVTLNATFKKYTRTDAKEETCDEDGNTEYYTGDDGFYYTYDGTDFTKIDENSWIIEAKGHNYNVRPIWEWNEDWSEATATFVCANDSEHTVVLEGIITESTTAGKIGEKGEHIIVATVEFNGRKYTNHKITKMPATTVKKIAAKDATCSEEGNIEYYAGSDGKFYVLEDGKYVEIAIEDTVIPVNDVHTFGEPTFVWGENNTVTAVFKCNDCGYEESRDAEVELVKTAPTYTENGKYVYTASVEADGVVYTDSKEVTIYSPDPIDVTYTPGDKSVNLTWNAVDGAEKYGICIMENGQWKKIEEGYKTRYTLTGLQPDTKYTVTVIPMVQNIWCSDFTHAIEVQANSEMPAGFPKVETQVSGSKFKLDWTAVDGAEKYGIAVYQGGKWVVKATVNGDVTSFTSPEVAAGTYKMVVCAKVNGKWDTRALNSRAFGVTIE